MRNIYICGKEPDFGNEGDFTEVDRIKKKLVSMCCYVVNPSELPYINLGWTDVMETRISNLKKCQAVYVMPQWRDCIISRIELTVAMDLKLEVIFHPTSNKELRRLLTTLDG